MTSPLGSPVADMKGHLDATELRTTINERYGLHPHLIDTKVAAQPPAGRREMTSPLGCPVADLKGRVGSTVLWATMIECYGRYPHLVDIEPSAGLPRLVTSSRPPAYRG
jgi:hypothetical protein